MCFPTRRLMPWGTNIWVAEQPLTFCHLEFGCRMTVIRLSDNKLFIHSPVSMDNQLKKEVDALGSVSYLIAPNKLHHLYMAQWQQEYPLALTFAPPGLLEKRKDINWYAELTDGAHDGWREEVSQVIIRGSCYMEEVVFCHHASRTLIVADLVENFGCDDHWRTKLVAKIAGMYGKPTLPPDWRLTFCHKDEFRGSIDKLLSHDWDRVILAHGKLLQEDARQAVISALRAM